MAFLFGSSTPQLSLVEQLGNSTLQYRTTRDAVVQRTTVNAFETVQKAMTSFASCHVENSYTFNFGVIAGWTTTLLSVDERNRVVTGVTNLFIAQNIRASHLPEVAAITGAVMTPAVTATLTLTWPVPATPIVPVVPVPDAPAVTAPVPVPTQETPLATGTTN